MTRQIAHRSVEFLGSDVAISFCFLQLVAEIAFRVEQSILEGIIFLFEFSIEVNESGLDRVVRNGKKGQRDQGDLLEGIVFVDVKVNGGRRVRVVEG